MQKEMDSPCTALDPLLQSVTSGYMSRWLV